MTAKSSTPLKTSSRQLDATLTTDRHVVHPNICCSRPEIANPSWTVEHLTILLLKDLSPSELQTVRASAPNGKARTTLLKSSCIPKEPTWNTFTGKSRAHCRSMMKVPMMASAVEVDGNICSQPKTVTSPQPNKTMRGATPRQFQATVLLLLLTRLILNLQPYSTQPQRQSQCLRPSGKKHLEKSELDAASAQVSKHELRRLLCTLLGLIFPRTRIAMFAGMDDLKVLIGCKLSRVSQGQLTNVHSACRVFSAQT